MNARERFLATLEFERVRPPFWEMGYWVQTLRRWYREGMPKTHGIDPGQPDGNSVCGEHSAWPRPNRDLDRDVHSLLDHDPGLRQIPFANFIWPAYELEVVEEGPDYRVVVDDMGIRKKVVHGETSVPQYVGWPIADFEDLERLKAERLAPDYEARLPADWENLKAEFRDRDYPLTLGWIPCGFYGSARYLMGEENLLVAYKQRPELVHAILDHMCTLWCECWSRLAQECPVDAVYFWEDMCYKGGPMISPAMFREFMMPYYKRLTAAMRDCGVKHFMLDTDGDHTELTPLFLEAGVTGLYPLEVAAGMDAVTVRREFPQLQIAGGVDKMAIARGRDAIDAELDRLFPAMFEEGGFIPHIDHMVHPDIAWEDFIYYRRRLRDMMTAYYGD